MGLQILQGMSDHLKRGRDCKSRPALPLMSMMQIVNISRPTVCGRAVDGIAVLGKGCVTRKQEDKYNNGSRHVEVIGGQASPRSVSRRWVISDQVAMTGDHPINTLMRKRVISGRKMSVEINSLALFSRCPRSTNSQLAGLPKK